MFKGCGQTRCFHLGFVTNGIQDVEYKVKTKKMLGEQIRVERMLLMQRTHTRCTMSVPILKKKLEAYPAKYVGVVQKEERMSGSQSP